jgi:hypothetical protein
MKAQKQKAFFVRYTFFSCFPTLRKNLAKILFVEVSPNKNGASRTLSAAAKQVL